MTNKPKKKGTAGTKRTSQPAHALRKTPLDAECRDAVGMLVASMLGLRRILWGDEPAETTTHIAARMEDDTALVAEHMWTLATVLLHRALGTESPRPITLDAAVHALGASMFGLDASLGDFLSGTVNGVSSRARQASTKMALDDVGTLLHEVAFEECDAALHLATERDGTHVVVWQPVAVGNAFVELLGPLFEMAEYFVETDTLLFTERAATGWWFSRWTVTGLNGGGSAFATQMREQEWVFGTRPTLATGTPIVTALCEALFAPRIPRRQRALANALVRSRCSLFIVRARAGNQSTLEDITDAETYVIHEHSATTKYLVGDIGAGRLLEIGEGVIVRSPGMVFFTPPDGTARFASSLGPVLREARTVLRDATIAVEAVLAGGVFGQHIPRNPPAATSPRDAHDRLWEFNSALSKAGLSHEMPADEAPPEVRAQLGGEGRVLMGYDIDEPLADYAAALATQANIPGGRSGASGRNARKKRDRR